MISSVNVTAILGVAAITMSGCGRQRAETPFGDDVGYANFSDDLEETSLTEDGGRVDWSHAHDLIAFDREGDDRKFDVWVMSPDGSGKECFTCEISGLPDGNVGQPAWSPDGAWLVVQAEKNDSGVRNFASNPGRGVANELWAISYPGKIAARIHAVGDGAGNGTLHPHFSADGGTLLWSEMIGKAELGDEALFFGNWRIAAAPFSVVDGEPVLGVITEYNPGDEDGFYENHGLSPDGAHAIFSANLDRGKTVADANDIYWMDFPSGEGLARFTTDAYNEHAAFHADGERVMWMSNAGNRGGGSDYWIANRDRSELARLTELPGGEVAADFSIGPDGTSFVAFIQPRVFSGKGRIARFDGLP